MHLLKWSGWALVALLVLGQMASVSADDSSSSPPDLPPLPPHVLCFANTDASEAIVFIGQDTLLPMRAGPFYRASVKDYKFKVDAEADMIREPLDLSDFTFGDVAEGFVITVTTADSTYHRQLALAVQDGHRLYWWMWFGNVDRIDTFLALATDYVSADGHYGGLLGFDPLPDADGIARRFGGEWHRAPELTDLTEC